MTLLYATALRITNPTLCILRTVWEESERERLSRYVPLRLVTVTSGGTAMAAGMKIDVMSGCCRGLVGGFADPGGEVLRGGLVGAEDKV